MKTFSNYLFYFILSCLLLSCDKMKILSEDYDHEDALNSCTKIVIKAQEELLISSEPEIRIKAIYSTRNIKHLESFRNLFKNSERTGYCCCPETNYTISFINNENTFMYYEVDTIEFNDKVRIFENSYQYSYLIEKKKWKNLLDELTVYL